MTGKPEVRPQLITSGQITFPESPRLETPLGDLSLFEKTNGSRQPRFKPVLDRHFKDKK
jgi:hypothetical protein